MRVVEIDYSWDPTSGLITFSDVNPIVPEYLFQIWNVVDGVRIYDVHTPGYGGTFAGNVLEVQQNTSAMSNTDPLMIFYEDGTLLASEATLLALASKLDAVVSAVDGLETLTGALTETAPATDTASSGLNGRLQRLAQRLTALIALLPAALGAGGGLKIDGSGTALPVSGTVAVTGVATEVTLAAILAKIIAAPATETKQDTQITAEQAILAKIIAAPATEAKQDDQITRETAISAALGATTGAAVITDANGTIQQYLRGLVKQWIAGTLVVGPGTNTIGKTYIAYQTTKSLTNASVSASSSGENTLVSGTASQTIRVFKIVLVAASAVSVSFKDAAGGTALTGAMPLTANGAMVLESNDGEPLFVSATAGAFILNLSAAVTVTGFIQYTKS